MTGMTASALWSDVTVARRFRAMNTDIEIRVADPSGLALAARAAAAVRDIESRFSRFRDESELSRFNARRPGPFTASPEFAGLLRLAQRLHALTGGIFEPGVLPALEATGYDRSFEHVPPERMAPVVGPGTQRGSVAEIRMEGEQVIAPLGLRLDFGGVGKGYAVDRAACVMAPAGDFVVSAGGDMYASGSWSGADGWLASVVGPDGCLLSSVWLRDRALATSTTAVRRWRRGGVAQHHIIDPRTGAPSCSGVCAVSAIAPSTAEADVFAKAALILGAEEGMRRFAAWGVAGLFVLDGGSVAATPDWPGEVH